MSATITFSVLFRKITILNSRRNPIWTDDKGTVLLAKQSEDAVGIKFSTWRSWARQPALAALDDEQLNTIIETVNNRLDVRRLSNPQLRNISHISKDDFADDIAPYEFAEKFGFSRSEANAIVDESVYRYTPLLPSFYYEKKEGEDVGAEDQFRKVVGTYDVYRYGTSSFNREHIYVLKLHVRSVLAIGVGDSPEGTRGAGPKRYCIRCKLTVANRVAGRPDKVEYDGFVGRRYRFLYWLFESRKAQTHDLIFMITEETNGQEPLRGTYLSINQDPAHDVTARRVWIERRSNREGPNFDESVAQFLKQEKPEVLEGAAIERLSPEALAALNEDIAASLSPELNSRIARLAAQRGVSPARIVQDAVELYSRARSDEGRGE